MGYSIKSKTDITSTNLWDAEAEALVAVLAKKLEDRGFKATDVVRELNYLFLRKRKTGNKKNYGATAMQMNIIKNRGC